MAGPLLHLVPDAGDRPIDGASGELDAARAEIAALKVQLERTRRALKWHSRNYAGDERVDFNGQPLAPVRAVPAVAPPVARDSSDLVALMRDARVARGWSGKALDLEIGWAEGLTSKIEQPARAWGRRVVLPTFDRWLHGLELGLGLVDLRRPIVDRPAVWVPAAAGEPGR